MSGVHRFLSRREKQGKHQPGPSDRSGLFVPGDAKKKPSKEEEKKVKDLMQHLETIGAKDITERQVLYALRAKSSEGDPQRAFSLLMLLEDSLAGLLKEYSAPVKMLGAANRDGVTCYLDALLFAMFARLDSFEAILYPNFEDEPRKNLAAILRLWVNMLRTGKLITTDITKQLQEAIAACGWKDAAKLRQQDSSEAFTFITDKLQLPLITLKMDIFHTGKEDASDDHKFVNERLLEVAIPQDVAKGGKVTLEACLETYFNNRIEVKRHLHRISTIQSTISGDQEKAGFAQVSTVELGSRPSSPTRNDSVSTPTTPVWPGGMRERGLSIFSERKVDFDEKADLNKKDSNVMSSVPRRRRQSSIRKEVLMPAWQFFSLIPWYTSNAPKTDAQVAQHLSSKRPVLGIALKRYSITPQGKAVRLNTQIDIPLDIGLPHFVSDDRLEDNAPLFGNFKLSLQSVVCHRGVKVDAGHYVALVRSETGWLRFDDLRTLQRVSEVNIQKALAEESPYLLFYQVQPILGTPSDSDPPPYQEHADQLDTLEAKLSRLNPGRRTSIDVVEVDSSTRTSIELHDRSTVSSPGRPGTAHTDASQAGNTNTTNSVTVSPSSFPLEQRSTQPHAADTSTVNLPSATSTRRLSAASAPSSTSKPPDAAPQQRSRGNGSRAPSSNSENRLSMTLSRFTSRLSRERGAGADDSSRGGGAAAAAAAETDPDPDPETMVGEAADKPIPPASTDPPERKRSKREVLRKPVPASQQRPSNAAAAAGAAPPSPNTAPVDMSPAPGPSSSASSAAVGKLASAKDNRGRLLKSRAKMAGKEAAVPSHHRHHGSDKPDRECQVM